MGIDATSLQTLVGSLSTMSSRETQISTEISSGVRLTALSDDPTAAGQAVTLANSISRGDSFLSSASTVANRMQASDTALSSVVTQLTSAISTAVGAVNDGTDTTTAVTQLTSIRESLLSLANSSYAGGYLFSGTSTAQPFTEAADGTVTYAGNSTTTSLPLASGGSVQSSLAGSSVFTASASVFGTLNDLISALTSGTVDSGNSSTLVGNLRDALTNVSTQRAVLDTAQNRLSSETDYITGQTANLQAQQTTLLSANTASLATELSAVTTQRSALLSTISVVEKGSLFDYISG